MEHEVVSSRLPVVYTCVTGGYDHVPAVSPEWACQFVLFHDGTVEIPAGWKGQRLRVEGIQGVDLNRYAKMLPHRLGLDADVSLYVDGNVFFRRDPARKIRTVLSESRFAAYAHPARDCAYAEHGAGSFEQIEKISSCYVIHVSLPPQSQSARSPGSHQQ